MIKNVAVPQPRAQVSSWDDAPPRIPTPQVAASERVRAGATCADHFFGFDVG